MTKERCGYRGLAEKRRPKRLFRVHSNQRFPWVPTIGWHRRYL